MNTQVSTEDLESSSTPYLLEEDRLQGRHGGGLEVGELRGGASLDIQVLSMEMKRPSQLSAIFQPITRSQFFPVKAVIARLRQPGR